LPYTCGRCHSNPEVIEKFDISVNCPTMMYTSSVHGKVNADDGSGATCSSCHGVHDIKNRVQPGSKISTFNIPSTCEKCHAQIAQEYTESIHWIRVKQGVRVSPVCTDCHCEHGINAINSAEFKKDEIKRIQEETCFRCHENPILAKKFETNVGNLKRYQDSYHGLAVIRGDEDAAMCVDCHGVHKILPKRHPESEVNEANVTNTCQKCHPEANEIFSKSYSHISQSEEAIVIESWVEIIYVWLIIVVIGGMVLHNLLIFVHSLKQKRRKEKGQVSIPRLTRNEVIQHILLLTSFILLVITGFALKYPEAGWAKGLTWLGMSEPIRQLIHKSSAVLMLALSFYHIFYLAFTKRGRNSFMELIPTFEDVTAAIHNVLYYLGLRKEKPEFTDYDYAEKAEYWALIWGTIVMGITGLVLWFPTVVGEWAPIWFIKVSEIIHFYEAILASLAIVVWHLFFVIFRPGEYPMSLTWIDGKMSLKHYKHHHEKQFIKISEEILRYDKAELKKEEMSYHANLFYDTIESNGHDPVQSILDVIESNEKLLKHFKLNP
ncbi:MAG: cytochrome b/b6 domain-containing protein, partial [Bacteroidetes bacterium]|nr:cytochrome b/b6 domain-containing protein [Bacteroidota bacterium]